MFIPLVENPPPVKNTITGRRLACVRGAQTASWRQSSDVGPFIKNSRTSGHDISIKGTKKWTTRELYHHGTKQTLRWKQTAGTTEETGWRRLCPEMWC